jgi:prepilin-type N-terminal cleavage/methylation domain-containing protein/prepilin-type processing-associated H-X9-DG protein
MFTEKAKAFTLIELLVVIAIIAMLLAVIIPAMRKAKEQTKFTICKTGLYQYSLAGEMYLMDHDGAFPNAYQWLHNWVAMPIEERGCAWHDPRNNYDVDPEKSGQMWSYIDSKKIHVCPKLREIAKPYGRYHTSHVPYIPMVPQYCYSINAFLGYYDKQLGVSEYSIVPKKHQVKVPTTCVYFTEESTWTLIDLSTWSLNNNHFLTRVKPYREEDICSIFGTFHQVSNEAIAAQVLAHINEKIVEDRYMGVANAVFLDGHLEVVSYRDSFRLTWPK